MYGSGCWAQHPHTCEACWAEAAAAAAAAATTAAASGQGPSATANDTATRPARGNGPGVPYGLLHMRSGLVEGPSDPGGCGVHGSAQTPLPTPGSSRTSSRSTAGDSTARGSSSKEGGDGDRDGSRSGGSARSSEDGGGSDDCGSCCCCSRGFACSVTGVGEAVVRADLARQCAAAAVGAVAGGEGGQGVLPGRTQGEGGGGAQAGRPQRGREAPLDEVSMLKGKAAHCMLLSHFSFTPTCCFASGVFQLLTDQRGQRGCLRGLGRLINAVAVLCNCRTAHTGGVRYNLPPGHQPTAAQRLRGAGRAGARAADTSAAAAASATVQG